jgi:FkbM family methyltransferase
MKIAAKFFKLLFKISFFRNRYFGFYKRIFRPYRLFRGQSAICLYDNNLKIKVDLEEWIQQHIYFLGAWDEPGSKFLKNYLKAGDIFMDIGANIGCYTMIASKIVGSEGEIHAFEPVSKVFDKLLFNIQLNNLSNISTNRKAVYETSGTLEFFVSSRENEGMSSIFRHDTESGEIEKVKAISIDEYVEKMNIQRIDMMKIDIEGAEIFALKGMKNTIKRFKPIIIMELSEDVLRNIPVESKDVLDIMRSMNYVIGGIDNQGKLINLTMASAGYTNFAFRAEEGIDDLKA